MQEKNRYLNYTMRELFMRLDKIKVKIIRGEKGYRIEENL
jgi:hypothetical protein